MIAVKRLSLFLVNTHTHTHKWYIVQCSVQTHKFSFWPRARFALLLLLVCACAIFIRLRSSLWAIALIVLCLSTFLSVFSHHYVLVHLVSRGRQRSVAADGICVYVYAIAARPYCVCLQFNFYSQYCSSSCWFFLELKIKLDRGANQVPNRCLTKRKTYIFFVSWLPYRNMQ